MVIKIEFALFSDHDIIFYTFLKGFKKDSKASKLTK